MSSTTSKMADDVERRFDAAVNVVRSMPNKGAYQPSYDTMLKFYGYFKQAKEGECTDPKPGFWDVIRKAKWEAWSTLGNLPKQDAMECYVEELKRVMESMPDNEEVADFSQVLKSFYETVYEPDGEEPPPMLQVFKKDDEVHVLDYTDETTFKMNGHVSASKDDCNLKNPHKEFDTSSRHIEGNIRDHELPLQHRNNQCLSKETGHTNGQITTTDLQEPNDPSKNFLSDHGDNLNGVNTRDDVLLNDMTVESSSIQPIYIVEVGNQQKKDNEHNDSGFPSGLSVNGNSEVPKLQSQTHKDSTQNLLTLDEVISESDESDEEEFCDSLDPEHLSKLQNGYSAITPVSRNGTELSSTLDSSFLNGSETSGSPDHLPSSLFTESEISDGEMVVSGTLERFTSTPFGKKAIHVTFADGKELNQSPMTVTNGAAESQTTLKTEAVIVPVNNTGSQASCTRECVGDKVFNGKHAGILKPNQVGSGQGGGDAARVSGPGTGRGSIRSRQLQGHRSKDVQDTLPDAENICRGYRDHSDSDSDDDHPNGRESCDSSCDRDEANERILVALEMLQQDMNRVLSRLGTMEDAVSSRIDVTQNRSLEPWWKQFIPSKTVAFFILWPFVINLVFHFFRRRKSSK